MAREIPLGARGEAEETVEFQHTLTSHHPAAAARLFHARHDSADGDRRFSRAPAVLRRRRDHGRHSINIEHRAASGIGARIKAEAVLESFDGRFYTLRVTARDDTQEIGRGTVGRAVVSVGKFLEKMKSSGR